jgi:hypothetical protein
LRWELKRSIADKQMEDPIHTTAEGVILPAPTEPDAGHAQNPQPSSVPSPQETIPFRELEARLDKQENCQRSWGVTDVLLLGMYLLLSAALVAGAILLFRHFWH